MNVFKQYITLLHWIPHLWKASKFDKIRDKYCIRYLIKLSDLVIIYLLFFAFARTFIESREGMFNRFAKRVRNSIDSEKFGFVSACNIDRTLEKSRSAKTRWFRNWYACRTTDGKWGSEGERFPKRTRIVGYWPRLENLLMTFLKLLAAIFGRSI